LTSPNFEPVTLFSRSVGGLNHEPVTLLCEAYCEPVTLSEGDGGGRGNGKRVVRQRSKPRHWLSAGSGNIVGGDNS
jgi:hypothetical protein